MEHVEEETEGDWLIDWLIDWVKALRPTRPKIGHFGDVPQANLLAR